MRIVFFGCTEFGFRCCETLIEMGEEVVGIFSIPQHFRISYSPTPVRNVTFRSFEALATEHAIPLVNVETRMTHDSYLETLRSWKPDFGLAIGWYYLVPKAVRDLFPKGVAGIHASLLPKYRGGAPLVWALINGEEKTGVTLFYFDDGVDTGDVIAQRDFPILETDTISTLYDKAANASSKLLREIVPMIRSGLANRIPQAHEQASTYPQRKPKDGLIDWTKSPKEIRNFIRAQTKPYPGAFTIINGKKITIWDADINDLGSD